MQVSVLSTTAAYSRFRVRAATMRAASCASVVFRLRAIRENSSHNCRMTFDGAPPVLLHAALKSSRPAGSSFGHCTRIAGRFAERRFTFAGVMTASLVNTKIYSMQKGSEALLRKAGVRPQVKLVNKFKFGETPAEVGQAQAKLGEGNWRRNAVLQLAQQMSKLSANSSPLAEVPLLLRLRPNGERRES